jgi:Recombinase
MKRIERMRQMVSGPLEPASLKQQSDEGWKLVAVEWEREVETAAEQLSTEVPFGLRIGRESQRLEQDPAELETLLQLMELIVQEGSYSHIAEEINRRGFRTREGMKWTPVSVFEMLPRLIEVGPQLFQSAEWQKRREHIPNEH